VVTPCLFVFGPIICGGCATQALAATSGHDPVAALDWLCLHVPEHELSLAFAPRMSLRAGKSDAPGGYISVQRASAFAAEADAATAGKRQPFGRAYSRPGGDAVPGQTH
jgi:hypothetical protein